MNHLRCWLILIWIDRKQSWLDCNIHHFLQFIAWVVLNCFPQGKWLGRFGIYLSYLMARASRNYALFKTYPSSSRGSTLSQPDAHLSQANEMVLSACSWGRHWSKLLAELFNLEVREFFINDLVFTMVWSSCIRIVDWRTIRSTSRVLNNFEEFNLKLDSAWRQRIPRPPRRVCRAKISPSVFPHWSKSVGETFVAMISSTGWSMSAILEIVLRYYVNLCL